MSDIIWNLDENLSDRIILFQEIIRRIGNLRRYTDKQVSLNTFLAALRQWGEMRVSVDTDVCKANLKCPKILVYIYQL